MREHTAANDPVTTASVANASDSLAQVREILFGDQLRHLENQLADLEGRLREHQGQIRSELSAGFNRLQEHLDGRLAVLDKALEDERAARVAQLNETDGRFGDATDALAARLGQLDADLNDGIQVLQRQLADRLDELAERFAREHSQLDRRLQNESALLQSQKVAGDTLAALLEELAGKLRDAKGPTA